MPEIVSEVHEELLSAVAEIADSWWEDGAVVADLIRLALAAGSPEAARLAAHALREMHRLGARPVYAQGAGVSRMKLEG